MRDTPKTASSFEPGLTVMVFLATLFFLTHQPTCRLRMCQVPVVVVTFSQVVDALDKHTACSLDLARHWALAVGLPASWSHNHGGSSLIILEKWGPTYCFCSTSCFKWCSRSEGSLDLSVTAELTSSSASCFGFRHDLLVLEVVEAQGGVHFATRLW